MLGRVEEANGVLSHHCRERVRFVHAPINAPVGQADGWVVGTNRREVAVVGTVEVSFKVHFKLSGDRHTRTRVEPLEVVAEPRGPRLDMEFGGGVGTRVAKKAGQREIITAGRRTVVNKGGLEEAVRSESDGAEFDGGFQVTFGNAAHRKNTDRVGGR